MMNDAKKNMLIADFASTSKNEKRYKRLKQKPVVASTDIIEEFTDFIKNQKEERVKKTKK